MIRYVNCIIFAALIFLGGYSCSKDKNTTDTPVEKVDTLSTGWSKLTFPGVQFNDIYFQDNTTGYVIGSSNYKSLDGGVTWTKLSATFPEAVNLTVTNDGKLFVCGHNNIIYRSTDGGAGFSPINMGTGIIDDTYFLDNTTGYSASTDGLLQTIDGGVNWAKVSPAAGLPFALFSRYNTCSFINSNTGWIASDSMIYKSNGSINSWTASTFTGTKPSDEIFCVFPVSTQIVYLGCGDGKIYKSTNGGTSFAYVNSFPKNSTTIFLDLHFIDANLGYASYGNHIYKTTDGANSWQMVVSLKDADISEIHFTDASHGWACSSLGHILKLKL